ncbi:hypothetical protein HAX54_008946 [Datura stramonium]|uniref:ATPase AAA-type core domain-containing protein n=1 Tax=Datura stramonium TaxID=4076 RepID=A0ABS8RVP9_DATST|nr:hypothetical protein [Datura stramonium]
MVELGMLTAVMTAAAVIVGAFLASAVFAVTSFVFAVTVKEYDKVVDVFTGGGIFSKLYEVYAGGILQDIWQGIEFLQSKPQASQLRGSTGVTFNDVAGIMNMEELQELVRYLKNPELFDKMGIKPPHGVLLEGISWMWQDLVAKAQCVKLVFLFTKWLVLEFVKSSWCWFVCIRDLFKRAKVNRPSVIFIDEIDALATRATNRRDLLDPALLRPGRFDRKESFFISDKNSASQCKKEDWEILKVHARKVKLSNTVDLASYAQNLPGWSGAKLAQLLQEAALVAVRRGHNLGLQPDMDGCS